jgi:Helicase HerA, central domain
MLDDGQGADPSPPMPHERVIYFGRTAWTDAPHFPCHDPDSCPYGHDTLPRPGRDSTLFGMRHTDRLRHMLILGQTGMGKTTLLHNLLLNDIAAGVGVALVDPNGDLVTDVMQWTRPLCNAASTRQNDFGVM